MAEGDNNNVPVAGELHVDDNNVVAAYANFCRVNSTPEEIILDLGLNPNQVGGNQSIRVANRIVVNHFTAKRLVGALQMALAQHERTFGPLEIDVRKRVRTQS